MTYNHEHEMRIAVAETQRATKVTTLSMLRFNLTLFGQQRKTMELTGQMGTPGVQALIDQIDAQIKAAEAQLSTTNDEIAALDAELHKLRGA